MTDRPSLADDDSVEDTGVIETKPVDRRTPSEHRRVQRRVADRTRYRRTLAGAIAAVLLALVPGIGAAVSNCSEHHETQKSLDECRQRVDKLERRLDRRGP